MMNRARYIVIIGPTASGKSALALQVATALGGELVNCDSVQVYSEFNIGSAKPSREERQQIPHHLWDIVNWHQDYDARLYAEQANQTITQIGERGKWPILVGGTGLYLRALWGDRWHDLPKSESLRQELSTWSTAAIHERLWHLDPQRAAELHPNDRFRLQRAVEIVTLLGHPLAQLPPGQDRRDQALVIRVRVDRARLAEQIAQRVDAMLAAGLIEEVQGLLGNGVDPRCKPMQSIGYAQVIAYLEGRLARSELASAIATATRQYAKRQETWFKQVREDLVYTPPEAVSELLQRLPWVGAQHEGQQNPR